MRIILLILDRWHEVLDIVESMPRCWSKMHPPFFHVTPKNRFSRVQKNIETTLQD